MLANNIDINETLKKLATGDKRTLARCLSLVENETEQGSQLLRSLRFQKNTPIIGITGPPGAGKSSLIASLIAHWTEHGKKIGIIAVDPSSPFNKGSLMGDRVRMNEYFLHSNVFIRSMASRGSLGGLSPKIIEATDIMKAADFDYILIETVGVGQSEVEIASLADTTILVLVPEAGDEIQSIKSGVMEIADIYVLNKADREGSDAFFKNLFALAHSHVTNNWEIPVIKTVATKKEGISTLAEAIRKHVVHGFNADKKLRLLAEKALVMIKTLRTKDISVSQLENDLRDKATDKNFNLYQYVLTYNS